MPTDEQDPSLLMFLADIGSSLKMWQLVEFNLCLLFVAAIDCKEELFAYVIYHSLQTFRTQLNVTDELLKFQSVGMQMAKDWAELFTEIKNNNSTRNRLVHWTYFGDPDWQNLESPVAVKSVTDPRNIGPGEPATDRARPMSWREVKEAIESFKQLHEKIEKFRLRHWPSLTLP